MYTDLNSRYVDHLGGVASPHAADSKGGVAAPHAADNRGEVTSQTPGGVGPDGGM